MLCGECQSMYVRSRLEVGTVQHLALTIGRTMQTSQSVSKPMGNCRILRASVGLQILSSCARRKDCTRRIGDNSPVSTTRLEYVDANKKQWRSSRKDFAEVMGEVILEAKKRGNVGGVFFDLDDTLVLTHQADGLAHSAVLELVKANVPQIDRFAVVRWFTENFVAWDPEHKVDVIEWRARLWAKALEEQGVVNLELAREMQSCFDRERLRAFRWASGVEALVRQLHTQGIKVGVITNGHPVVQRAKLQACKAAELFDTILVGGEEPKSKPHKDIFLKACLSAGCKPEESVMVGDTLTTDILGGINSGFLATVWVNIHKEELSPHGPKPNHIISNITELKEVLEQLGVSLNQV